MNLDLFKNAGVAPPKAPWAWGDLLRLARGLTVDRDGDGAPELVGLSDFNPSWYWSWVWSNGGDLLAADGRKTALTQAAAYEAFQWWADLTLTQRVTGAGFDDFVRQRAAIANAAITSVTRAALPFDWTFLPYPGGKGGAAQRLDMSILGITQPSKVQPEAWQYLKWLASEQGQAFRTFSLKQGVPAHKKVLLDRRYLLSEGPPHDLTPMTAVATKPLPQIPTWDRHDELVRNTFRQQILSGRQTARAALSAIEEQLNEIVATGLAQRDADAK